MNNYLPPSIVYFILKQLHSETISTNHRLNLISVLMKILSQQQRNFIYKNFNAVFVDSSVPDQYLFLCEKYNETKDSKHFIINTSIKKSILLLSDKEVIDSNYNKFSIYNKHVNDELSLKKTSYKNFDDIFDNFIDTEIQKDFSFEFLLLSKSKQLWRIIYNKIHENFDRVNFHEEIFYIMALPKREILEINDVSEYTLEFLQRLSLIKVINKNIVETNLNCLYGNEDIQNKKSIIIESNHRLYAYTDKMHTISILKLFARIIRITEIVPEKEFFISGIIDEDVVRKTLSAKESEIKLERIIDYIQMNGYIDPNLVELIKNWNKERMVICEGILLEGFMSYKEYSEMLKKVEAELIFKNDEKRILFIKEIAKYDTAL